MLQQFTRPVKDTIKNLVHRSGYQITRLHVQDIEPLAGLAQASCEPPSGAREYLRGDNPHLLDLRRRYAALNHPVAAHSHWTTGFVDQNVDLLNFRGDNAYLWQVRQARGDAEMRYFANTLYIERIDHLGLLSKMVEDGAFGCHTFKYEGRHGMSRDLLDSINEIYFLDRQIGLFDRPELRVLDIGAGYGRLAHRMSEALPNLKSYVCVDAVPESTFLAEYYLKHRGLPEPLARAVPLDKIDVLKSMPQFDVAVNIHSFTECNYEAIRWWLNMVSGLNIRWLLIAPNKGPAGSEHDLFSIESDQTRRDFTNLLEEAGYRQELSAPKFDDPHLQAGIPRFADTYYHLFRKVA